MQQQYEEALDKYWDYILDREEQEEAEKQQRATVTESRPDPEQPA
jgi:hypothetical protein